MKKQCYSIQRSMIYIILTPFLMLMLLLTVMYHAYDRNIHYEGSFVSVEVWITEKTARG